MKKTALSIIGLATFTLGLNVGMFAIRYKDNHLIDFRTTHNVLLMDVINNIYETDSAYFQYKIRPSSSFKKLQEFYHNENPDVIWEWEDMYNY